MSRASDMQGFLPDDYVELKTQRRTNVLWAAVFLIVAAGIGSAFYIAEKKIRGAETANKIANDDYAAAAKPIEQFNHMREEQEKLNKQAQITASLVEKVNRTNILAEITNCLPRGMALVDFSLDGKRRTGGGGLTPYEKQAVAAAGKVPGLPEPIIYDVNMRLRGLAFNDQLVSEYMAILRKSKLFSEVSFIVTEETTYKDKKLRAFEFEIILDPTADSRQLTPGNPSRPKPETSRTGERAATE